MTVQAGMTRSMAEDLGWGSPVRRKTSNYSVPVSPIPTGRFAPFHGPHVCRSKSGRWRPEHYYVDNVCLWCGGLEVSDEDPDSVSGPDPDRL